PPESNDGKRMGDRRGRSFAASHATIRRRMPRRLPFLLSALLLPAVLLAQNVTFHNGKVVTADASMTVHEAVAVRNGKITAVGPSSLLIEQAQADGAALLDLEGRTVLPGLIDSHVHALSACLSEFREALPPLD